jgi:hypothetical protein
VSRKKNMGVFGWQPNAVIALLACRTPGAWPGLNGPNGCSPGAKPEPAPYAFLVTARPSPLAPHLRKSQRSKEGVERPPSSSRRRLPLALCGARCARHCPSPRARISPHPPHKGSPIALPFSITAELREPGRGACGGVHLLSHRLL